MDVMKENERKSLEYPCLTPSLPFISSTDTEIEGVSLRDGERVGVCVC